MNKVRWSLLTILVAPWFSIPLLGKKAIKKYLPTVIVMSLMIVGEGVLAKKRRWWLYYKKFTPNITGEISIIWGPFLVGSLWILKYTYKHFVRYLSLNLLTDSFYTYVIMGWFKKIGFASLIRLKKYQLSLLFIIKSLVLYLLQKGMDKYRSSI